MPDEVFLSRPTPAPSLTAKKAKAAHRKEDASRLSFEETLKERGKQKPLDEPQTALPIPTALQTVKSDAGQPTPQEPSGDLDSRANGTSRVSASNAEARTESVKLESPEEAGDAQPGQLTSPPSNGGTAAGITSFDGAFQKVEAAHTGAGTDGSVVGAAPSTAQTAAALATNPSVIQTPQPGIKSTSAASDLEKPTQTREMNPDLAGQVASSEKDQVAVSAKSSVQKTNPAEGMTEQPVTVTEGIKNSPPNPVQAQLGASSSPIQNEPPKELAGINQPASSANAQTGSTNGTALNDAGSGQPVTLKPAHSSGGKNNPSSNEEDQSGGADLKGITKKTATQTVYTDQVGFSSELQASRQQGTAQINKPDLPVVQQIIDKIEEAVQQGRTSLRLQLNPKDLGVIDIRLVSQGHSVSITLIAEHAGTSQLLEKQMDQLRENLAGAGINLANVNVGHQSTNGQTGSSFLDRPIPEYLFEGGSETANSKIEPVTVSHLNRAGNESRIDYRI